MKQLVRKLINVTYQLSSVNRATLHADGASLYIRLEIRAMEKQWEGRLPGLVARRDAEAALVESAARK